MFVASLAAIVAAGEPAALQADRHFRKDPPMPAYTLPDVLTTIVGEKIATSGDWTAKRRPEVLELFRQHVYGRVPETKAETSWRVINEDTNALNGAATLRNVEVKIATASTSLVIRLNLFIPNNVRHPVPAFLMIGGRSYDYVDASSSKRQGYWPIEAGVARGYAMAAFFTGDVDPDVDDAFRNGIHGMLDGGKRTPDSWGTIAAWAWGASRCLDYLETDKAIAKGKVAIIGHSRCGKTALWAGAQDERFGLVVSNDSGCGGAALSRRRTEGRELVASINRQFPHWFCGNFKKYNDRENDLPVDQHMLIALIAPRPVAVGSAAADLWADPRGEFLGAIEAAKVYRLFGKTGLGDISEMPAIGKPVNGDVMHYHIREGKHELNLVDWKAYMDFADRVFGK